MGKRINPNNKIMQKSVGFKFRQWKFFSDHPEFKPDDCCRDAVDNQIRMIDPKKEYLGDD
jgi:hypothetical protein